MLAFLRTGHQEPSLRGLYGIEIEELEPGRARQRFSPPPWAVDGDDLYPGVLGLAADSTLGAALASALPLEKISVTLSMRVDMIGPVPRSGGFVVHARRVARHGSLQVATGEAVIDGQVVATMTMRTVAVPAPPARTAGTDFGPLPQPDHPAAWAPFLTAATSDFEITSARTMANGGKLVHGGVAMILAERAARGAVIEAGVGEPYVSSLSADYLAPLPCDGAVFRCHGAHVSRRGSTALASGTVLGADEKPTMVTQLNYRLR